MANKQTQNFEEYVFDIPSKKEGEYTPYMVEFVADMYKGVANRSVGKINFSDIFSKMIPLYNVVTNNSISSVLSGKYLEIDENPYGISAVIDYICSKGGINGVFIQKGIRFAQDESASFIGNGTIDTSSYGDTANSTIDGNVCKGTFGMETVYIKDLYVKNLHTADSSISGGSSNTMDEIKVDSILPKSEGDYNNIYIGSGITFHGNPNYSLIKYEEVNLSQVGFTKQGSIDANYCYGAFVFDDRLYATGYFYTRDVEMLQDDGTTKSLKETISKLEARIAALEAK